ncbi:MAG: hypothetical protein MUF38_18080 [Anaerolineae bacterium]|nr:hypothetical protein [Anaerolineae bacterium]
MSALEREIIEKFRQLDKPAQKRVRALIERTTEEMRPAEKQMSWVEFIDATYGSLVDDPLDEIDNTHLLPPVRYEVE